MLELELPFRVKRPILACGADLKGSFALAKDKKAFLVDGFKDLSDPENFASYQEAIARYGKKLKIRPKIVACDLHPGYFSTCFAESEEPKFGRICKVQHHEAHVASAIVDNSIKGDVIGIAFDGTGFGSDGNIWGGEFFIGTFKNFRRVTHLAHIPMPGADAAIREPWRMAASFLYNVYGNDFLTLQIGLVKKISRKNWDVLKKMIDNRINSPLASSVGRLFDAAASIILVKEKAAFEAELPVELERIARQAYSDSYDFVVESKNGMLVINPSQIIRGIVRDISKKIDKPTISAKFHNSIAGMILEISLKVRKRFGVEKIVLSGGVFQNKFLTARAQEIMRKEGFKIYTHSNVQTNDSGIPVGQIAIANARLTEWHPIDIRSGAQARAVCA